MALGGSRERDRFGFGEAAQKGNYATHHMNSKLTEVSLTDVSQEIQDANAMKK